MTASIDFVEPGVEFLAEQDGVPERELKAELCRGLEELPAVRRAYLAVVQFSGKSSQSIALCLVASAGSESTVVPKIGAVFFRMFNPDQSMDIMFVNDSQELLLSQVCTPFFQTPTP